MGRPPNVVVVVLDTVRADRVSALGHDRETTPNFDAFAEEATLFTDAVAQAPWSIPSQATLFTGQYPREHGATIVRPVFDVPDPLPARLSAAGYATHAVSPNGYVRPATGFGRGFDTFERLSGVTAPDWLATVVGPLVHGITDSPFRRPVEGLFNAFRRRDALTTDHTARPDDALVDTVKAKLASVRSPYFLFVNLLDCHLPRSPLPEYATRFLDDKLRDIQLPSTERAHALSDGPLGPRQRRALCQLYDADLRTMDDRLGRLLDVVERTDGETLTVLAADHGEHLGEFGMIGHQYSVFEPAVSVPLAVQFPDGGPDRVDRQVELRRVFHTVLDETGVEAFPEQSLASGTGDDVAHGAFVSPMVDIERYLRDGEFTYETDLLGEPLSFVRDGDHKLVRFADTEWFFTLPETDGKPADRDDALSRLRAAQPSRL
ncbi:MAG: sulfatase [Halovenus sp.]